MRLLRHVSSSALSQSPAAGGEAMLFSNDAPHGSELSPLGSWTVLTPRQRSGPRRSPSLAVWRSRKGLHRQRWGKARHARGSELLSGRLSVELVQQTNSRESCQTLIDQRSETQRQQTLHLSAKRVQENNKLKLKWGFGFHWCCCLARWGVKQWPPSVCECDAFNSVQSPLYT